MIVAETTGFPLGGIFTTAPAAPATEGFGPLLNLANPSLTDGKATLSTATLDATLLPVDTGAGARTPILADTGATAVPQSGIVATTPTTPTTLGSLSALLTTAARLPAAQPAISQQVAALTGKQAATGAAAPPTVTGLSDDSAIATASIANARSPAEPILTGADASVAKPAIVDGAAAIAPATGAAAPVVADPAAPTVAGPVYAEGGRVGDGSEIAPRAPDLSVDASVTNPAPVAPAPAPTPATATATANGTTAPEEPVDSDAPASALAPAAAGAPASASDATTPAAAPASPSTAQATVPTPTKAAAAVKTPTDGVASSIEQTPATKQGARTRAPLGTRDKSVEPRAGDTKADDAKADDAKIEDAKTDDTAADTTGAALAVPVPVAAPSPEATRHASVAPGNQAPADTAVLKPGAAADRDATANPVGSAEPDSSAGATAPFAADADATGDGRDARGNPNTSAATPEAATVDRPAAPAPRIDATGTAQPSLAPQRAAAAQPTAPAATANPTNPAEPVIDTNQGKVGHKIGIEIARRIAGGEETLRVRLTPEQLGKVDVTIAFDDGGSLRATVHTEHAAAADLLRRDTVELNRALDSAGVRTDAQSFRFESGSQGSGQNHANQYQREAAAGRYAAQSGADSQGNPVPQSTYRTVADGRVDLLA